MKDKEIINKVFSTNGAKITIKDIALILYLTNRKNKDDDWISVDDEMPKKTEHRPSSMSGYKNPIKRQPNIIVCTNKNRVFETPYSAFGWANVLGDEKVMAWQPFPRPHNK